MPRSKRDKKLEAQDARMGMDLEHLLGQDGLAQRETLVFVDLDGTLVDFEQGVSQLGAKPDDKNAMWDAISNAPRFWRALPWLPDGNDLWEKLQSLRPVILTGLPSGTALRKRAEDQKRAWCRDYLGPEVAVLCVDTCDKHKYSGPGRILIDDCEMLREAWEQSGGHFILRQGLVQTIASVETAVSRNVSATPCVTQLDPHLTSAREDDEDHGHVTKPMNTDREITTDDYSSIALEDDAGLAETLCKLNISDVGQKQRASLVSAIRSMVTSNFQGRYEACLVGSSGAGLANANSDLDFALVPSCALHGDGNGEGISTEGVSGEQLLLEQLAQGCERECGLRVEIVLTRSKAPDLVKCVQTQTGLHCDIVVRSGGNGAIASVDKATLLRSFVEASHLFRPLVRMVKLWAKARQLIDPVNGKLNSFTWTLMTAFFLQINGLLPIPDCSPDAMRRRWLASRMDAPPMTPDAHAVPGAHLVALLQAFFAYWRQFDYRTSCVSVRRGCCTTASGDMPVKSSKKSRSTQDSRRSFLVEDPVELDENTARTLSDKNLEEVRAEFNRAFVMFEQGLPWDRICHVPTVKKSKELKMFFLPERPAVANCNFTDMIVLTTMADDIKACVCKFVAEMPCGDWHTLPQPLKLPDRQALHHCLVLCGMECRRVGNTDEASSVELFKLTADELAQRSVDQPSAWTECDRAKLHSVLGSVSAAPQPKSSSRITSGSGTVAAAIVKPHSCLMTVQKLRGGASLEDLQNKYKLIIKTHPEFGLAQLSYSQTESQMASPLVQECRGLILERDTWNVVALPFRKFFNYGEKYATLPDFESESVRVYEKLDGSLMTLYWYNEGWHVATSKLPAANGVLPDRSMTFADMFWQVWREKSYKLPLNTKACYMFELLTPNHTIIVRHAQADLVCIGGRDMVSLEEIPCEQIVETTGWDMPRRFDDLKTLDAVVAAARLLNPVIQEGFVVVDQQWRRTKVKSASYVALHHLGGNYDRGGSSGLDDRGRYRSLVQIARNHEGDEFLAYYPQLEEEFHGVLAKMLALERMLEAGGCEAVGSASCSLVQRFTKKMRQESLSAREVLQQAKIQDLESALDFGPTDTKVDLVRSRASPSLETITSQMPDTRTNSLQLHLETKLEDEDESHTCDLISKQKNRFQALLADDSSDSE